MGIARDQVERLFGDWPAGKAPSVMHRFEPQAVLFSLSAREAIAGVPLAATAAEVDNAIGRFIGELRSLWRRAREIGERCGYSADLHGRERAAVRRLNPAQKLANAEKYAPFICA